MNCSMTGEKMKQTIVSICTGAILLGTTALQAGKLQVTSNFPSGLAEPGKMAKFQISYTGKTGKEKWIRIRLFFNGIQQREKIYSLKDSLAENEFCGKPGWIAVTAELLDEKRNPVCPPQLDPESGCGVLVEPENIKPARPRPEDFEIYWNRRISELRKIPVHAVRKPSQLPCKFSSNVLCEDLQLNAIGDIPVSGYLLMPKNAAPKSLPAVIYFHGAGIRSSIKQTEFASHAIVLDINAHGVPNGRNKSYYRNLMKQDRRDRVFRNRNNREKAYLNGMFLRVVRSIDYIRSLPEWNGKDLIVFGRSQGGAQAIAAAALVPEVSLCIANVPALGDHGGFSMNRLPGWPRINTLAPQENFDPAEIAEVSDYFDIVNFAPMIRCPVRMTAGLIDFTCPPTSVHFAYNQLPEKHRRAIEYFPALGHAAPMRNADGREWIGKELKK